MLKIYEIQEILKAAMLTGDQYRQETIVSGGGADRMDDILEAQADGSVLLTGNTSEEVVTKAKVAGVSLIVFVRGKKPPPGTVELAREHDVPLLTTAYSLFVASGRLYMNGLRGLDGSW